MDWNRVHTLLSIVEKSAAHGAQLSGITQAALTELKKHQAGEVEPTWPENVEPTSTDPTEPDEPKPASRTRLINPKGGQ